MSTMRTALDFPRNEAGLVDKFLGTAFDAVYTIYLNLEEILKSDSYAATAELAAASAKASAIAAALSETNAHASEIAAAKSVVDAVAAVTQAIAARDASQSYAVQGLGYLELSQAAALRVAADKQRVEELAQEMAEQSAQYRLTTLGWNGTEGAAVVINDRSTNLDLPLPNSGNKIQNDVSRIRESFTKLDSEVGTNKKTLADFALKDDFLKGAMLLGYRPPFTGSVPRTVGDKLAETVHVNDFGAVGDGVTNDTPAFQRAIDHLRRNGGGTVNFNKRHLIDTNLYVEDWVHLKGTVDNMGELRYDGASDFDMKGSQLIINPNITITIRSGSTVSHALVMRKGLDLPFADLAAAQAGVAAFSGTAFTAGGSDTSIHHLLVLGFNKIFYSNNFERCRADHIQGDCTNGIEMLAVYDIAYIDRVHLWPFTTTHRPWTTGAINARSGFGIRFANVGDWSKITNCFTYNYAKGFTIEGCNFVNLIGCGTDGYGPDPSTSIGFEIIGNSKMTTLIACQAAAQGYAIVVDNNPSGAASTAAVTKIQGCCFWDNDIKHVDIRSGRAIFNGNSLWRGPVGIDVNSAAQAIIDNNDFEDITANAISSGSFDNLNVGPSNRFTNCANNFGQRKVLEANATDITQYSGSTVGGVMMQARRSRGTTKAKTALVQNDQVMGFDPYVYDGTNFISGGTLRQVVRNNPAAGNAATAWILATRADAASSPVDRFVFESDGSFKPAADGTQNLGGTSNRFNNSYFAVSPTVTSDARSKTDIKSIDDKILDAWAEVEFTSFKLVDAVKEKGKKKARIHFGVIAQRVMEAFQNQGLDPFAYGILCHEGWEGSPAVYDEDENLVSAEVVAGDRYGVRYEEALVLECALMRRSLKRLTDAK